MIVVFYLSKIGHARFEHFEDAKFMIAMSRMEALRQDGYTHVCMSTELEGSVGKPGVDTIDDGKTPDGQEYDWSKQHRGAGPQKLN